MPKKTPRLPQIFQVSHPDIPKADPDSELRSRVLKYRTQKGLLTPDGFTRNVVVVKYERDGVVGYMVRANSPGKLHSETEAVKELERQDPRWLNTEILQVYTERHPCSDCRSDLEAVRIRIKQDRAAAGKPYTDFPVYYSVPTDDMGFGRAHDLGRQYFPLGTPEPPAGSDQGGPHSGGSGGLFESRGFISSSEPVVTSGDTALWTPDQPPAPEDISALWTPDGPYQPPVDTFDAGGVWSPDEPFQPSVDTFDAGGVWTPDQPPPDTEQPFWTPDGPYQPPVDTFDAGGAWTPDEPFQPSVDTFDAGGVWTPDQPPLDTEQQVWTPDPATGDELPAAGDDSTIWVPDPPVDSSDPTTLWDPSQDQPPAQDDHPLYDPTQDQPLYDPTQDQPLYDPAQDLPLYDPAADLGWTTTDQPYEPNPEPPPYDPAADLGWTTTDQPYEPNPEAPPYDPAQDLGWTANDPTYDPPPVYDDPPVYDPPPYDPNQ